MSGFKEEILSQGKVLERWYDHFLRGYKNQFKEIITGRKRINRIIFSGMGSSLFAAYVPYYMLKQAGVDAEIVETGEFLLHGFPRKGFEYLNESMLVLISQSGETGEIVELIKLIQVTPIRPYIIGITNDPTSYLSSHSDKQIILNAGIEETVTSKTYTCTLLVLFLLGDMILEEKRESPLHFDKVKHLIENVKNLLENEEEIANFWSTIKSSFGIDYEFVQILSRGPSLATAHQGALNFKEIVKISSEACTLSTFRHGGIESLNSKSKLILIASSYQDHESCVHFIKNLVEKWSFGSLLYITNESIPKELASIFSDSRIIFHVHDINDSFLSPLMEILFLQLICYKTAKEKGIKPGKFRFSEKITKEF